MIGSAATVVIAANATATAARAAAARPAASSAQHTMADAFVAGVLCGALGVAFIMIAYGLWPLLRRRNV